MVDTLDVDSLEDRIYKLLAQAHRACHIEHTTAHLAPAVSLQDGHVRGLLDMANLVGGLHTLAQEFKQLGVNLVNLLTAEVQLIVKLGVVGRFGTPYGANCASQS